MIRPECEHDRSEIHEVVRSAFEGMSYAAGDEAELVDVLREAGALAVSLVAELDGKVVGYIAFSPAQSTDGTRGWYALGPVAVLPACQGLGIGSKLVRTGLQEVLDLGATGCILTGSPTYYARFGFSVEPSNAPSSEPPEFFMVKLFSDVRPHGPILFHPAFHSAV
jgi:putative acetyltransferase